MRPIAISTVGLSVVGLFLGSCESSRSQRLLGLCVQVLLKVLVTKKNDRTLMRIWKWWNILLQIIFLLNITWYAKMFFLVLNL